MSNVNITRSGPEQFGDNKTPGSTMDYTTASREFRPVADKGDWRLTAVLFAGGLLSLLLVWVAFGIWKTTYCWDGSNYETCQTIVAVEPITVGVLLLSIVGISFWRVVISTQADIRQKTAYANRTNMVLDRFGNAQPADLLTNLSVQDRLLFLERRYAADISLKLQTAPYEVYASVNTLSGGSVSEKPLALAAPIEEGPDVGPLPISEWQSAINSQPHVLLAAKTSGGKSTLAKSILAPRIEAGEKIFIVDPHSSDWFDLPSVGGGEDWSTVERALGVVLAEYRKRLQERDEYKTQTGKELSVSHFERLTVVVDEVTITKAHFDTYNKKDNPWLSFVAVLGSGARKVRISVILLAQSANVDDLGISGPLRENFTRIALCDRSIKQLVDFEERDAKRRAAIFSKLPSLSYPAVAVIDSSVFLLDRTGLDRVREPALSAGAAWTEGYEAVRSSVRSEIPENGLLSDLLLGRTVSDASSTACKALTELQALKDQGLTRDQVRASGVRFTNADWSKLA